MKPKSTYEPVRTHLYTVVRSFKDYLECEKDAVASRSQIAQLVRSFDYGYALGKYLSHRNFVGAYPNEDKKQEAQTVDASAESDKKQRRKYVMCLLIAAHNEELVLGSTIKSAISAGMKAEHIYVVDDNSSDSTSEVAKSVLPEENVLRVGRSGKGLALSKGAAHFDLTSRYRWIHIADADGAYSPDYFTVFRREIDSSNAAATGYIKSLPGARISEFRAYEYTVGMELHRRIQSILGVISIIPGPTSCFRADIFDKLDFTSKSLTEDFDVTMQIHRQNLGDIQFIPDAVAYTQDPLTLKGFINQITRWNRGVLQGMVKHRVGRKMSPIDAYLMYQLVQSILLFVNCFVYVPYMTLTRGGTSYLAMAFVMDVLLTFFIASLAATKSKRPDIIGAFPFIYAYKWVSLVVFMKAFVEVMLFRKYRLTAGIWDNDKNRRYQMQQA